MATLIKTHFYHNSEWNPINTNYFEVLWNILLRNDNCSKSQPYISKAFGPKKYLAT